MNLIRGGVVGGWLNRDPMGSRGFNLMIKRPTPLRAKPFERYEGANLYRAFRNSSLDNFDALGLGVNCGSGATSGLVPV